MVEWVSGRGKKIHPGRVVQSICEVPVHVAVRVCECAIYSVAHTAHAHVCMDCGTTKFNKLSDFCCLQYRLIGYFIVNWIEYGVWKVQ